MTGLGVGSSVRGTYLPTSCEPARTVGGGDAMERLSEAERSEASATAAMSDQAAKSNRC